MLFWGTNALIGPKWIVGYGKLLFWGKHFKTLPPSLADQIVFIRNWSGGGTHTRKLTTRARKSVKRGTRFRCGEAFSSEAFSSEAFSSKASSSGEAGREEWRELSYKRNIIRH